MIISHKYKFIFIKTGKVGGTSLEIALAKHLGADDIITPIKENDEQVRRKKSFATAQNYLKPLKDYKFRDYPCLLRAAVYFFKGKNVKDALPKKYYNHISAHNIRNTVSDEVWNTYFKFTIERNPYDKLVSQYYWNSANKMTFREFIKYGNPGHQKSDNHTNFDFYSINGYPVCDYIIKYENLENDLHYILNHLNMTDDILDEIRQIKTKESHREKPGYENIYDEEMREIVSVKCARELAYFGYRFDENYEYNG